MKYKSFFQRKIEGMKKHFSYQLSFSALSILALRWHLLNLARALFMVHLERTWFVYKFTYFQFSFSTLGTKEILHSGTLKLCGGRMIKFLLQLWSFPALPSIHNPIIPSTHETSFCSRTENENRLLSRVYLLLVVFFPVLFQLKTLEMWLYWANKKLLYFKKFWLLNT